jgi:imidazole glycerol-phosphate synthase subunit HisH
MIAIVDYGAGNLRSVTNAFRALGADVQTVDQPAGLEGAEKVVLPGVGAFGAGMDRLRAAGFVEPLREAAAAGTPLLGICLGLQYLFEWSDEMGRHEGLGLLPGYVTRFPFGGPDGPQPEAGGLKVPHIGWNALRRQRDHALLDGLPAEAYAYFVHSYYALPADPADVLASTGYGIDFASVVARGNVMGIQPHPEKSQSVGLRILRNFVTLEPGA